ncbi:MAG: hypothetical protein ABWZ42_01310 [Ilumatobacteraceae bacterium]
MGTWPRLAVLATISFIVVASSTIGSSPHGAALAQSAEPADIREVMLDEVGGLDLTGETTTQAGAFTRRFTGAAGELQITGFAVTTPPGTQTVFAALPTIRGFEFIDHPSLASARWLVPAGTAPGEDGLARLYLATRDHIFTIVFNATDPTFDGPGAVEAVARAQIEKAGPPSETADTPATESPDAGTPDAGTPDAGTPTELEARLGAMIPEQPPAGYGLDSASLRLPGFSRIENDATAGSELVSLLNDRARGFTAAWAGAGLSAGVGISKYPYEIFAASDLAEFGKLPRATIPDGTPAPPLDAVVFEHDDKARVGVAFRRGDVLVLVLADYAAPATASTATSFAIEEANLVERQVPAGRSTPYEFPTPPSKFTGLALTAGFVIAAVGGATFVARLRARRVRRAWSADGTPDVWPDRRPGTDLVQLDDDAAALRHRGAVVAVVQLVTIVVGVVALAGDFAWRGAGVAAASLVVGLVFSHWWLRHEHHLLGPTAPPRAFRVPRPAGAVMGIVAFAVLGFGVAFLLKGARYLIFSATPAQLRWANLLGMTPRDVGIVFAFGGLLVAFLGAMLWRAARALGRARVREVLAADPRPPVLYLRSFADDSVPLPIIASARRPLFELFSVRGADPFEECVAWELDSYGPVVAVGRPGGRLASLGAAREHLPNDTWHDEIQSRMRDAGWIALAPGDTDGLAWELEAIVSGGHLDKTIFVFPPLAPTELDHRWAHTSRVLRAAGATVDELPAPCSVVHTLQFGGDDAMRVTWAFTRDEATYRTAVDRSLEPPGQERPHQERDGQELDGRGWRSGATVGDGSGAKSG